MKSQQLHKILAVKLKPELVVEAVSDIQWLHPTLMPSQSIIQNKSKRNQLNSRETQRMKIKKLEHKLKIRDEVL